MSGGNRSVEIGGADQVDDKGGGDILIPPPHEICPVSSRRIGKAQGRITFCDRVEHMRSQPLFLSQQGAVLSPQQSAILRYNP